MYIFFDTETTGFPRNWKAPVTAVNNWPRMVQIAWVVYDNHGNELEEVNYIIQPEGYTIPKSSERVHGISTARAKAEGQDLKMVLEQFAKAVLNSKTIVAHNMAFDEKIVGAEFIRKNIDHNFYEKDLYCTMKNTTNVVRLPGRYGYKWPSLDELHRFLFHETFEEQHNALADIRATAKCFWELKNRNLI
jgi:DNA polymerase III epsilon subunit-like protein